MLSSLLAAGGFVSPHVDYHALAPEIVLGGGICLVLLVDLFVSDSKRWITGDAVGLRAARCVPAGRHARRDRRRRRGRCSTTAT